VKTRKKLKQKKSRKAVRLARSSSDAVHVFSAECVEWKKF